MRFSAKFHARTLPGVRSAIAAAVASMLLVACASTGGIAPSAVAIDHVTLTAPAGLSQLGDAWPQDAWWRAYGDPQLDQLIEHALANSPTLAAARTRIAHAQSALDLSRAAAAPQATADVEASYGRQSENYLIPKPPIGIGGTSVSQGIAAIDFGYDLDLWGKNTALIRSAQAQTDASIFDRDAAQLALTTTIARTYMQLAAQYALQDVLLATQKQRKSILSLAGQRLASGLDTKVELKQAETSEVALRVDLVQLETQIDVSRLQLAALTGDMPSAAQQITRPAPTAIPFAVPRNLPLDLLGRRPELAAQRARINAAIGEADAAKAQFYPNINLAAVIGFQAIGLGNVLNSGSLMTSVGPALHLPLFDGGRLRANYAAKTADIDGAIAQYNQAVLAAAQDVAEQLTRVAALAREEEATRDAYASAAEAYRLAMLRYRGGLSPYLTALTVETQLLTQQRVAIDLKAKTQDLHISLVRALGGGFADTAPALAGNQSATH